MNQDVKIRPYEAKDAFALRKICKETAWDSYKKDEKKLETVPINFLDYFIEQEPRHVFVAVNSEDEPVGYIECASSYRGFKVAMKRIYMPRLKAFDRRQISFERQFLLALFFIRKWPCHMHINLTGAYQHQGIGSELIKTLIAKLKEEGFHSLAICGNERNSNSWNFYLHCGFKEIFNYGRGLVSLGIEF
jgi:GNAT superfamily N-acetyltransferase